MLEIKSTENGLIAHLSLDSNKSKQEYKGHVEVCQNPACQCSTIFMKLSRNDKGSDSIFQIGLDLLEHQIFEEENVPDNFITQLSSEMTEGDWSMANDVYQSVKKDHSDNYDIEKIASLIDFERIAPEDGVVYYRQCLPFADKLDLEIEGQKFAISDAFCLKSGCRCNDSYISITPIEKGQIQIVFNDENTTSIYIDYKKKKLLEVEGINKSIPHPKVLFKQLQIQNSNIWDFLNGRHKRLKEIYRLFLKNKKENDQLAQQFISLPTFQDFSSKGQRIQGKKIGRNEPCPCGSGKKYKKCCL